ncbi:MAG TPA: hypothetical protein VFI62_09970, partial [Burkholderiales bacterium]|nr:hypothetical protein [Burkholderiales bacterium]
MSLFTRNRTKKVAIGVGILCFLSFFGLWLLSREATLIYVANYLVERMEGRLQLADVRGSLLGTVRLRALRYDDKFGKLAINDAHLEWKPLRLLRGQVAVGSVSANTVTLDLARTDDERSKPPQSLRSPIPYAVTDFRIEKLAVTQAGATHEVRGLHAGFSGGRRHLQAELKALATQYGTFQGEVKLGADSPFDMQGTLQLTALEPQDYSVRVKLDGTLINALAQIDAQSRAASLTARLAVAPFDWQPLTHLEFVAKDFDPRAWSATAPQALISGEG